MILQQEKGVENINLVTPTSYAIHIKEAIKIARTKGLHIPIVYNTNGYESVETLKMLEGYIDIYLPDFKYYYDELGKKYSNVYKYFPQVMHLTLLILIIFSCIKLIKEKDYTSYKYILSISMVGIIVFLLIWENRSRYILTMFPIYLALAIDGIDYIGEKLYLRAKEKNTW